MIIPLLQYVGSGRLTRQQLNNLKTAEPETDRMRAP
jgi:hypothetical protein